jgi:hypothetical protein
MANKKLQKWERKRNAKLRLYAKVVKATRKELAASGIDYKYNEARKFTSEFIYGQFKNQPPSKVKVKDIRDYAKKVIDEQKQKQPPAPIEQFIDPRVISEIDVANIDYWDMDDFLSGAGDFNIYQSRALQGANMGKNLRFEVIISETDRTGELTLLQYDGMASGVRELIEKVREITNNSSGAYFMGVVGRREGMKDDSDPNSYILQFILYVNDEPVVPPDEQVTPIPRRDMTAEEIEEFQKLRREQISEKEEAEEKKKRAEKQKARRQAKRPTKKGKTKEPPPPPPPKEPKKKTTRGDRVLALNEQKLKELEMLRKDLDDGIINKREYKKERTRIQDQYEQALNKLKRGGVV